MGVHFQQQILLKILPTDGAPHLKRLFLQINADHGNNHDQNQPGCETKEHRTPLQYSPGLIGQRHLHLHVNPKREF